VGVVKSCFCEVNEVERPLARMFGPDWPAPLVVEPLCAEKLDLVEDVALDMAVTASFMVMKVLSAWLASCISLASTDTSLKIDVAVAVPEEKAVDQGVKHPNDP
jgi:hypothetical protein